MTQTTPQTTPTTRWQRFKKWFTTRWPRFKKWLRECFERWWLRFLFVLLFALMISAIISLKLSYEWQRGGFEPAVRVFSAMTEGGFDSRYVSWDECYMRSQVFMIRAHQLFFWAGGIVITIIFEVRRRLVKLHDDEMEKREQLAKAAQPHVAGGAHP